MSHADPPAPADAHPSARREQSAGHRPGIASGARRPGLAVAAAPRVLYPAQILPVFITIGLAMGLSFVPLQIAAQAGVPAERAGLAVGLINTSQEVGGALGVAAAATYAFRRVSSLTAAAHGDPHLIEAARTTVFHDGFSAGATFAVIALLTSVIFLPRIPRADAPVPP